MKYLLILILVICNANMLFANQLLSKSDSLNNNAKPNILVIMADDCTFRDLPIYGGKNVNTPNIDLLASQSKVFNRAYLSMAMCTPSRAELLTGLYPLTSGIAYNHGKAKKGTKSIVQHLDRYGYRTGIAGKIHVGPEAVFPFEMVEGIERRSVSLTAKFDEEGIQEFITRNSNPFCLMATLVVPHAPWTVGNYKSFDQKELILPPNMADTPLTRENYAKYLAEIEVLDKQVGKILGVLENSGKADNTIVVFTSEQGSQFPFNKWTNYDLGLHTGFIVRWPGQVQAGTRTDAIIQYADFLPTIMDIITSNQYDESDFDGTSFNDVLIGKKQQHRTYAYGMHHNVPEGPPYPIRSITNGTFRYIRNLKNENLYIEKHLMGGNSPNNYWSSWIFASTNKETIRNLVNSYMKRPEEELYNTVKDPYERINLLDNADSDYLNVKNNLSDALDEWMDKQNDTGSSLDDFGVFQKSKK